MFLLLQYVEAIHCTNDFAPLLALQPQQQSAILSLVIIRASLIICSHVGEFFFTFLSNKTPQYTQRLSLKRTSFSSASGIFHEFIKLFAITPVRSTQSAEPLFEPSCLRHQARKYGFLQIQFQHRRYPRQKYLRCTSRAFEASCHAPR